MDAYQKARARQKEAKASADLFGAQLKESIGDDAGIWGDYGRADETGLWSEVARVMWSRFDRETVDMKRLRKEVPFFIEMLKQSGYLTSSPSGRLTVTMKKEEP